MNLLMDISKDLKLEKIDFPWNWRIHKYQQSNSLAHMWKTYIL